jgi:hypothetical protein
MASPDVVQNKNDPLRKDSTRVLTKLRSAITYLAISEVMSYFEDWDVSEMEISLIGIILYMVTGAFVHALHKGAYNEALERKKIDANAFPKHAWSLYDVQTKVLESVSRLSIMLSGQALAIWAQPDEFDTETALTLSQTSWVVIWIVGMLGVLSMLPGSFTDSRQGESFQSVLLYTFTNGIEAQFYKMDIDPMILFCIAIVLLYYLQQIHTRYLRDVNETPGANPNVFRCITHEACCMVLANVCIVGVLDNQQYAQGYANVLVLAQLITGVIFVGALAERIEVASSVQTLILWRASKEVWEWVSYLTTDDFIIFTSLLMVFAVARLVEPHISLTIILVISKHIVNVALRSIQNLPQIPSMVASFFLLLAADILTITL